MSITTVPTSAAHPFSVRQFLNYVWQFYLPRLPFLSRFRTTPDLPAYDIWLRQGTGSFGWLSCACPDWLYPAAAWLAGMHRGRIDRPRSPVFATAGTSRCSASSR